MNDDLQHLRLLSIFHYIVGGMGCLFACFPIIHMLVGIGVMGGSLMSGNAEEGIVGLFFGLLFFVMGSLFFLIGQAVSICVIIAGRKLAKRQGYTFTFVMACIQCIILPFGIILGIFTIVILSRTSVKDLYALQTPDLEKAKNTG
ncbi:hypothetical protein JYT61_00260 [bacterium AH-315-E10]|nr:hypothetical protein [bacterium AH-315-E10]